MCTLALFRGVSPRFPVVIAANRDEFASRPSLPPAPLEDAAGVIAGKDLRAGGTWLGCRFTGAFLAAGLLNRRSSTANAAIARPRPFSRGLICLNALRQNSVAEALAQLGTYSVEAYEPFNLLLADSEQAVVVDNRDGIHTTTLGRGLSVLTNLDVNDPRCPRLASAHAGFEGTTGTVATATRAEEIVDALAAVLRDHGGSADPSGGDPLARICVHAGDYGTRSSSILFARASGGLDYFHADDAPCRAEFRPIMRVPSAAGQ